MLQFDAPGWLLALGALPALEAARRRRAVAAVPVASCRGAASAPRSWVVRSRWLVPAAKALAAALMIVGLARPQWGHFQSVRFQESADLVLAIDASDTMGALDLRLGGHAVSRLDAVKAVARDFLARRRGDRIGVVVFGAEARTAVPRTTDHRAVAQALDRIDLGTFGNSTALGDAVALAVKRVRGAPSRSRAVVLLTDGRSNAGTLSSAQAAAIAASLGVKVYAIAIGSDGPVPIPAEDPIAGRRLVYRRLEVDEPGLRALAAQTGGRFFRVAAVPDLRGVYEEIDRLEKTRVRVRVFEERRDLYPFALAPAFVLLALSTLASACRWGEMP